MSIGGLIPLISTNSLLLFYEDSSQTSVEMLFRRSVVFFSQNNYSTQTPLNKSFRICQQPNPPPYTDISTLNEHTGAITDLEFSPDGRILRFSTSKSPSFSMFTSPKPQFQSFPIGLYSGCRSHRHPNDQQVRYSPVTVVDVCSVVVWQWEQAEKVFVRRNSPLAGFTARVIYLTSWP